VTRSKVGDLWTCPSCHKKGRLNEDQLDYLDMMGELRCPCCCEIVEPMGAR